MITPSASRASKYLQGYETTGYTPRAAAGSAQAGSSGSGMDTWRYGSPGDIRKAQRQPGGSYAGNTSLSRSSSTRTIRKGAAPELPELATFEAPKLDKRAVRATAQKLAAPGLRTLRQTVQQAMGRNFENPNVRKMTLREALRGYGTGLESVMAGANREARSEQMAELEIQRQADYANWKAQNDAAMAAYDKAWSDYMKGTETITEAGTSKQNKIGREIGGRTYTHQRNPFTGGYVPVY